MTLTDPPIQIALHLVAAVVAGGLIGLERSYRARPAGFRTHTLVCLASSLLMLITVYQDLWLPGYSTSPLRADPTRMAQGIMTGIGFLGAGVIFKEGLSVRGLTTAAAIWTTAAIGIMLGAGMYYAATLATVLTLAILSGFRWIESKMPVQSYARFQLRLDRSSTMTETDLRTLLRSHGYSPSTVSYRVGDEGRSFEYRMMMRTDHAENASRLAHALRDLPGVQEFRISTSDD